VPNYKFILVEKYIFHMTFFRQENDDMEKQASQMCDLAVDNFQNKNFDVAKKLLQKATELCPNHAMSWHNLGVLFKVMGNFNEALECYNKAIQYSSNPDFAYSRGVLLLQPNFCKNSGTAADPIKITGARDHFEGIQMEYLYLKLHYGIPNDEWSKISQKLGNNGSALCDEITIRLKDGVQKSIFFDISEFYGHIK
jgi:tetratricopeptide (TPR) repeat protein